MAAALANGRVKKLTATRTESVKASRGKAVRARLATNLETAIVLQARASEWAYLTRACRLTARFRLGPRAGKEPVVRGFSFRRTTATLGRLD